MDSPKYLPGKDNSIHVNAAGRDWILRRSGNLEELWNNMDAADFDEDAIPYWTELWPASLALAQWLRLHGAEIAGSSCLDAGCGLGLTALTGKAFGAKVAAIDIAPTALHFCQQNAEQNCVDPPAWLVMDWRSPAFAKGAFQFIWGADILYEKRFITPLADFIGHCLAPEGRAWIADPGRCIFAGFRDEIRDRGWSIAEVFSCATPPAVAGSVSGQATVWEILIPPGAKGVG